MDKQKLTRRSFLRSAAMTAVGVLAASCAQPTPQVIEKEVPVEKIVKETVIVEKEIPVEKVVKETVVVEKEVAVEKVVTATPVPSKYKEAPMLAEMVKAGKLPPVDERLPLNPKVIPVVEKIGKYGGTLRMGQPTERLDEALRIRHTGLFRYDFFASKYEADIAEGWAWSNDIRTLTIKLRQGHKWSDGEPFTSADMMFLWEQVFNHPELSPNGPEGFWKPKGEVAKWQAVDDYTVNITFPIPYPIAMDRFGRTHFSGLGLLFLPAHYLKQFHKDFNPKADELAKAQNLDDWKQLFNRHRDVGYQQTGVPLGRPLMDSWVPIERGNERVLLQRNPYFHHVDPEGNQLPYIDRIVMDYVTSQELYTLKVTSGEIDFAVRFLSMADMPMYRDNEKTGNYTTYLAQSLRVSEWCVMLNQTYPDPEYRKLFRELDFRVALSLGINRDRINDVLYFGLASIEPATPIKMLPWFDNAWYNDYLKYDPDQANKLLDKLGLTKRDNEGYRLLPDGRRLSIIQEMSSVKASVGGNEFCELIAEDWKAIGVETTCKVLESGLIDKRRQENATMALNWHLDRATLLGRGEPNNFGFINRVNSWGWAWAVWNVTGGREGEEPPQEIKDLIAIWDRFASVPSDSKEAVELGRKYYSYWAEKLPIIPTVGLVPQPVIYHNRLKNTPKENMGWDSDTNFYAPFHVEQFYIEE